MNKTYFYNQQSFKHWGFGVLGFWGISVLGAVESLQ